MPQVKYEQLIELQYTATSDNEVEIYLPEMIGSRVVQIERNIKPMIDWMYNNVSGFLNVDNGLSKGEELFIIYAKIITE